MKPSTSSIRTLLLEKSNNYDHIEPKLRAAINSDSDSNLGVSIILPFCGETQTLPQVLIALQQQDLPPTFMRQKVELVFIDDGSLSDVHDLLEGASKYFTVKYISLSKNKGRSIARNIALANASHEVVIFLDADMAVQKDYLRLHLALQAAGENLVVVGLRENITPGEYRLIADSPEPRAPNYLCDFRAEKYVSDLWQTYYPTLPDVIFNRTYHLLEQTFGFKTFGYFRQIGVWRLPSMVLTCNMSARREALIAVGAFDDRFNGWGMEDVNLGTRLIANGCYIIPHTHITAFHLTEPLSDEAKRRRDMEHQQNLKIYEELLDEKPCIATMPDLQSKIAIHVDTNQLAIEIMGASGAKSLKKN